MRVQPCSWTSWCVCVCFHASGPAACSQEGCIVLPEIPRPVLVSSQRGMPRKPPRSPDQTTEPPQILLSGWRSSGSWLSHPTEEDELRALLFHSALSSPWQTGEEPSSGPRHQGNVQWQSFIFVWLISQKIWIAHYGLQCECSQYTWSVFTLKGKDWPSTWRKQSPFFQLRSTTRHLEELNNTFSMAGRYGWKRITM